MSVTGAGSALKPLEERRLQHVGRTTGPSEGVPAGAGHRCLPAVVAFEHRAVAASGTSPRSRPARWPPDTSVGVGHRSRRYDGRPVGVGAEGLGGEVEVHGAGQRVRHHQRGRGQVVRAGRRGGCGPRSCGCPTAPRPPTGRRRAPPRRRRASSGPELPMQVVQPKPTSSKSERSERLAQPGPLVVVHDDPRARRQGGLHPRLGPQPAGDGLLGQQPGRQHHLGVGGVGAAGDGRDHHVAVGDVDRPIPSAKCGGHSERSPAPSPGRPSAGRRNARLGRRQRHAVLGSRRAGQARHHGGEVELDGARRTRVRGRRIVEQSPAPWRRPRPGPRARSSRPVKRR